MGYLKIITAILIWSSLGIFVRKAGLPILITVFYPALIAGVLQFFILSSAGHLKDSLKNAGGTKNIMLLSLVPFFFLANTFLFFYAFKHVEAGGVVVNDIPTFRADHQPYGGVKDSGLGREGIRYTIEDMTELKILSMNLK